MALQNIFLRELVITSRQIVEKPARRRASGITNSIQVISLIPKYLVRDLKRVTNPYTGSERAAAVASLFAERGEKSRLAIVLMII